MKSLNIKNEDKEVHLIPDTNRYQVKYYDSSKSRIPLGNYVDKINLSDLATRTEKLIQVNSMFGSGRIALDESENISFYNTEMKSLVINNPKVIGVVNKIVNKLGGVGTYIGLHIRTGDSSFKARKAITVENMRKFITANWEFFDYEIKKRKSAEEAKGNNNATDTENGDGDHKSICSTKSDSSFAKIPIYAATDLEPDSPELASLRKAFPCLFILSDFNNYLTGFEIVNPTDGVNIRKYLFPFIDLVVASKGGVFIGTKGSTFSGYSLQMFKSFGGKFGTRI